MNEATARIKINRLLEKAGWRFFLDGNGSANISLEPNVAITQPTLDDLGDDFDKTTKGFIDFLLLDSKGFPLLVLEAKSEEKQPLVGKEQARKYARSQNCRFVILSNGNLHYFWDLERGNPYIITAFPTPESVVGYSKVQPTPKRLVDEQVRDDYIVFTQRPYYASEAAWKNEAERAGFVRANNLRFLRTYQLQAVHALQRAVKDGNDRFLFEMATGTGTTLTATPRDYLRGFDSSNPGVHDPREAERRLLRDTYRTFGCESGDPTFRYSPLDGVKDGYLINPTVVDSRTDVTTQLLADRGFVVSFTDDAGNEHEEAFKQRQFEREFFSDSTNQVFCKTFLENALRDPVSGAIGKSIVFAVS